MSFIDSIKEGAIKAQQQYGICASLTMAQAILESGWGKYAPGNNLFGIKWVNGCGYRSQMLSTKEYYNGKWQVIQAPFRAYDSMAGSIYDHAKFLVENSRYKNLLGVRDYKTACKLIQQDGYATDPNYANSLIEIIQENKLYQYDNVKGNDSEMYRDPAFTPIGIECDTLHNVWDESGHVIKQFKKGDRFEALGMLPPVTDGQPGWFKLMVDNTERWTVASGTHYIK